jgi:hypothetical protein
LIHYAFTHLPFYGFTVFSCSRFPRKSINLPLYSFTLVSFASTPPLRFYAPKAARSDRKFSNFPFYGAFLWEFRNLGSILYVLFFQKCHMFLPMDVWVPHNIFFGKNTFFLPFDIFWVLYFLQPPDESNRKIIQ